MVTVMISIIIFLKNPFVIFIYTSFTGMLILPYCIRATKSQHYEFFAWFFYICARDYGRFSSVELIPFQSPFFSLPCVFFISFGLHSLVLWLLYCSCGGLD
ncbi:hypothetical protein, unlikely [Trypanosoma brucei brucei TREU927]|uniref:Uncharacterized protein n=1 Tax=Trypanosoma brucei brucei (strain 927/4 GUTat10.1) TaxID=185431 RepID=Q38F35_TRYB2|nr:hypothetical protein, unlikely [Trypanosoma brucei brucei TREU927]EAN76585.1 hypothetical protein, unlikely [Trypanosoma brucei brucei TREU927]